MKVCNYCGKQSEGDVEFCGGCGCALESQEVQMEPSKEPKRRVLNAGTATVILLAYLAAQFYAGLIAGIFGSLIFGVQQGIQTLVQRLMPAMLLLAYVFGGSIIVLLSVVLIPGQLKETSPCGAAWVYGNRRAITMGLFAGVVMGLCYIIVTTFLYSHGIRNIGPLTPLRRMSSAPGLPQISWMITAVLLAPPVEELLFRGVFFGGYYRSFGTIWAVILTTIVFVSFHFTELLYFPPAIAGVTGLAIGAMWLRLHFRAIGPSIAAHAGYNAIIAFCVFLQTR